MTPDEALNLATKVEGLFVETTPQQVAFLASQFEPFDRHVVDEALTRFRRQYETLNIANLLRRIADERQKQSARSGASATRHERRQIEEQWRRSDEIVARLSDDELHRRKQALLDRRPELRPFLKDKDPRQSRTLRALILTQDASKG